MDTTQVLGLAYFGERTFVDGTGAENNQNSSASNNEIKGNFVVGAFLQFPQNRKNELESGEVLENDLTFEPIQEEKKHVYTKQSVGKYTLKERQEKIRKYKHKILKWRLGINSNKDRYAKRRTLAQAKPRVKGKFIKQSLIDVDTSASVRSSSDQ